MVVVAVVVAGCALVACGVAIALASRARSEARVVRGLARTPDARAGEVRLAAALAACDDAMVILDRVGREVLRNPAAQRYDDPHLQDALIASTMHRLGDDALRGSRACEEVMLFGPPQAVVVVRAEPLYAGTEAIGALIIVRDVTDMRRTDQVRRDFVANVSHELKTPIGALTLLAETMAVAEDVAVQQQLADRVVREADRLAQIVEDLLDLSILEAQETSSREVLPVALIVGDAIDQVRPKADAGDIPIITTSLAPDVCVHGDRRQLTSAITNLLDNAVKYSDAGGIVEVGVAEVSSTVEITVRDHGLGIPARDLERIFERFYRVDRARSRATGGTGLGLAIVRHAVQAHGGEVTVRSVEGQGSEFTLRLPNAAIGLSAAGIQEGQLQ